MKWSVIIILTLILSTSCEEGHRRVVVDESPVGLTQDQIDKENQKKDKKTEYIERPDKAVILLSSPCACSKKKSLLLGSGSCSSFCANKTHEQEILYMNVDLDEKITLDDKLVDLEGWCTANLNPDTEKNLNCKFQAVDENNTAVNDIPLTATHPKAFEVDISSLSPNKIYRITLGQYDGDKVNATSTTIQIKKITENYTEPAFGPLYINPVTQYTCVARTAQTQENSPDVFYTDAVRYHFYFIERSEPDPLPQGLSNIFCHDIFLHGAKDSSAYERLEETPYVMSLWDHQDPRFADLQLPKGDNKRDIDNLIKWKVEEQGYTLTEAPSLFNEFKYPGTPVANANAGNQSQVLGMIMTHFTDDDTLKAYCPKQSDYFGDKPVLVAMRDLVGVDTEALYIGQKEKESYVDEGGDVKEASPDYIFLTEAKAKLIRFYYNANKVPVQPTDNNIKNKKILFFYPPDYDSPFVKKSHQRVYVIKSASELSATTATGPATSLEPHDKRIGCVPVTEL